MTFAELFRGKPASLRANRGLRASRLSGSPMSVPVRTYAKAMPNDEMGPDPDIHISADCPFRSFPPASTFYKRSRFSRAASISTGDSTPSYPFQVTSDTATLAIESTNYGSAQPPTQLLFRGSINAASVNNGSLRDLGNIVVRKSNAIIGDEDVYMAFGTRNNSAIPRACQGARGSGGGHSPARCRQGDCHATSGYTLALQQCC